MNYVETKLQEFPETKSVVVLDVNTERRCIVTTITLGATIAAVAGGAYKIVLDYDKLYNNVKLILSHLKGVRLFYKQKKQEPLPPPEIVVLERLPDEYKKLYASGQDVVFYTNSKGDGKNFENGNHER